MVKSSPDAAMTGTKREIINEILHQMVLPPNDTYKEKYPGRILSPNDLDKGLKAMISSIVKKLKSKGKNITKQDLMRINEGNLTFAEVDYADLLEIIFALLLDNREFFYQEGEDQH